MGLSGLGDLFVFMRGFVMSLVLLSVTFADAKTSVLFAVPVLLLLGRVVYEGLILESMGAARGL